MSSRADFQGRPLPSTPRSTPIARRLAAGLLTQRRKAIAAASIAAFLLIWQATAYLGVNTALFPLPTRVVHALINMLFHEHFINDVLASSRRLMVGYAAGAALGLIIGLMTGRFELLSDVISPVVQMLRPIPPISFVPIAIFWFGLGEFSKYFLVFWGVFFPVWLNVHLGVKNVEEIYLRAGRCLGAGEARLLFSVVFPGALPMILAGLRTAIPISFYTLVAAEIAGAYSGIAYRIDVAQLDMRIGHMFAGLVVLGIMSAAADKVFVAVTKKLFHWAYP